MNSFFVRKIKTATRVIFRSPKRLINILGKNGMLNFLSDAVYLRLCYRFEVGKQLDLINPVTISEKIQWLKIYDRQERYSSLVDKYAVRSIISQQFGEEYLIPLIGVYDSADEISWDSLPTSFVIKCTHGSGCNVIVKDKSVINVDEVSKQLGKWLKQNWYYYGREWPYKNIKPKLLIEYFQNDNTQKDDLTDYKFYCFNGEPTYCQVIGDRHEENGSSVYYIDFFDMNWEHMVFTGFHAPGRVHPHNPNPTTRPSSFDTMYEIAKRIAQGTYFVRVDFYEISGFVKFGEFTLYPMSGFGEFSPIEWNKKLGDMINISSLKK